MNGYLIALFLILQSLISMACSCFGPDVFVKSIGNLIVEVEVLGVKSLPKTSKPGKYDYTTTLFLIKDVVKGTYEEDTLYVLNDKGFECFHTIKDKTPGKRYILTGNVLDESSYAEYRGIPKDTLMGQLMVLDLCGENIVFVYGDKIKGNITENKYNQEHQKIMRFYESNPQRYEKALQKINDKRENGCMQSMSKKKLYALLRKQKLIE